MPGSLVTAASTVLCSHGGQARPTVASPKVAVLGQAVLTLPPPWTVGACPLPPAAGGPCATAMWTTGTTRVLSFGQPLVLNTGTATCAPTGVPLLVTVVQPRVIAQ